VFSVKLDAVVGRVEQKIAESAFKERSVESNGGDIFTIAAYGADAVLCAEEAASDKVRGVAVASHSLAALEEPYHTLWNSSLE
jgi:3-hydroxy-3-methylglutaryl CoA synthase